MLMTSSHGNAFRITGPLWGESTGHPVDSTHKEPVARTVDVSFDVSLNKLLYKQSSGWWFETPRRSYDVSVVFMFPRLGRIKISLGVGLLAWWRHQMETFSALLAFCAGNSPVPVNSPHKGQWRGALMFSLICVWINGWVNNREAGDWRRHRGHYDVNIMVPISLHLFCPFAYLGPNDDPHHCHIYASQYFYWCCVDMTPMKFTVGTSPSHMYVSFALGQSLSDALTPENDIKAGFILNARICAGSRRRCPRLRLPVRRHCIAQVAPWIKV